MFQKQRREKWGKYRNAGKICFRKKNVGKITKRGGKIRKKKSTENK